MADRAPVSFLAEPPDDDAVRRLYEEDVAEGGFVMNSSRVWGHAPHLQERLFGLLRDAADAAALTRRQKGLLVAASASARADSYCSLAWGTRLAEDAGADVAASVLLGRADDDLHPADRALAGWARRLAQDPNGTTAADVEALRAAGFDDAQILAISVYVAGRIAFSTVNGALGAAPDAAYRTLAPERVREAVTYGRPVASA